MARSLRPLEIFPITTRHLEVLRVADVTPGMRRVTLGGAELAGFTAPNGFEVAPFRSEGVDDEFKMLFHHPDLEVALGPAQADGVLNWPRDPKMLVRTYTARRWDPRSGELDVDFVKHGVGPATRWAYQTRPGDRIQIAGPKMSHGHPVGADWILIAGDETALPAIGRWLEEMPEGTRAQVFIEIAEDAHRQHLHVPDGVELTWLSRDGAEAGTTTLLYDAITGAPWWEGTAFAWVAGEALTLTAIRRWLRREKGLSKEQIDVTGYWRRTEVVVSTEDAALPDFEATQNVAHDFHELTELAPGFALRVAATIGLAQAFDSGPRTAAELATATGSDPRGLGKLLRYLVAIDAAEVGDDGRYALTPLGRELEHERIAEHLDLDGLTARRELGLLALLAAVRTGRGDYPRWFGAEYEDSIQTDPRAIGARVEQQAEGAVYVAGAFATSAELERVRTLVVTGRAAGTFAAELVKVYPDLEVRVLALPSELIAIRQVHAEHERISHEPGSLRQPIGAPVDAVLVTGHLSSLPDADAIHVLRQAVASLTPDGLVLVFGDVLDESLADDHDYEDDLIDFALSGGGSRDHAEHLDLFAAAGLNVADRTTIGWGYTLYRLSPAGGTEAQPEGAERHRISG